MASVNSLTIVYSTQYGTAPTTVERTVKDGDPYVLSVSDLPTLSYPGCTFLGWTTIKGSTSIVAVGDTPWGEPSGKATQTLYAVWKSARTIQTELDRLTAAKADIATAIAEKGVEVPEDTTLDGYAELVGQIEGGGTMTDADVLVCLIATDTIRAVAEDDGTIIADGDGAVLLM